MPPLQRGPCRVVVLIDTSKTMAARWPELAHQYIPILLDALPNAREDASDVSVSLVPIRDGPEIQHSTMRFADKKSQIQNLYGVPFGAEVSETAIWRGFERGVNLLCQPGDTSMKYLIVGLSSFPGSASEAGTSVTTRAPWEGFAQNIIKYDIRMTVIMEPVRSYKAVNDFFKHVLSQQKRQFTSPWFAYNARYHHFLISGFSKRSIIRERSKGGATGSVSSPSQIRGSPLSLPPSSSQRMDISDIQIGRKLGLVEELRRRTGFWPAGADVPSGSGGDSAASRSRTSSTSVRGTSQQKKPRSPKEREERTTPDSPEGSSQGSTPEFPAYMSSGMSGAAFTIQEQGYPDLYHHGASMHSPSSPIAPVPISPPQSSGYLGPSSSYPSAPHSYSNVYQAPAAQNPPYMQVPSSSVHYMTQNTSYHSPVASPYGSTIPQPSSSRSPHRPLSPTGRPIPYMSSQNSGNYRTIPHQEPHTSHHLDSSYSSYRWPHPSDQVPQVPLQYFSKQEDSSLYGWDGKK